MVSACTAGNWRQGQVWKSKASILTYLSRGNGEEVSGSTRQPSEHVIELPAVALVTGRNSAWLNFRVFVTATSFFGCIVSTFTSPCNAAG
jgi:hypothetical protein